MQESIATFAALPCLPRLLHDFLSPSLSLRLSSDSLAVDAFSLESCAAGSKQAKSKLKLFLGLLAILPAKGEAEEQGSLRLKMLARSQPFCGSQTASRAMAVMNAVFYLACWLTIAPL